MKFMVLSDHLSSFFLMAGVLTIAMRACGGLGSALISTFY